PNARAFVADLSIEGSEVALVDAVSAEMGEIDVLINNAAHCESPDVYQGLSSAGLERHSARAFPGQVGYGSSKAAREALTRGAALDLGGQERGSTLSHPGRSRPDGWPMNSSTKLSYRTRSVESGRLRTSQMHVSSWRRAKPAGSPAKFCRSQEGTPSEAVQTALRVGTWWSSASVHKPRYLASGSPRRLES